MGDLLSILSQSAVSMAAQRGSAATSSNNISNANTEGYARQSAVISAILPVERLGGAYLGQGATLSTVTQARDRFLETQLPAAFSNSASSSAQSGVLANVSALDPDGGAGLTSALGDFYAGLRSLSQNPGDLSLRQAAVSSAGTLALTFNRAATALTAARSGVDADLSGNIGTINALSKSVASLNREIRVARATGGEPNDLLDARQKAQDQLAKLVGATPVPDGQGNINLVLGNGQALVAQDVANTLSAVSDPGNGGHLALQLTGADGSLHALGPAGVGGGLGGELAARDGALKKAQDSLDTLAFDFASAVNTVHQAGYALDGSTGRDLYTTTGTASGAAAALTLNSALAADPTLLAAADAAGNLPGGGANLSLLVQTESTALSNGLDVSSGLASLTAAFGASAASASANATHDLALQDNLTTMRESTSGVSIDEEMVSLTRAQRGYEAIAKVMQTTNDMLDTLMSIKTS